MSLSKLDDIKGMKVEYKGIKGKIEQVSTNQEILYAGDVAYYEMWYYRIDIITEEGYEVSIKATNKETIERIGKAIEQIKEENTDNILVIY